MSESRRIIGVVCVGAAVILAGCGASTSTSGGARTTGPAGAPTLSTASTSPASLAASGSTPPSLVTSPSTGAGASEAAAPGHACALLTLADITAVTGHAPAPGTEKSVGGASVCTYRTGLIVDLELSPYTAAEYTQDINQAASTVNGRVEPVGGVADMAGYVAADQELCLLDGTVAFCLVGLDKSQAVELAKRASTHS